MTGDKKEKEFEIKAVLPKLGKDKGYQFHFEINQEKVRQVNLNGSNLAW